MRSLVPARSHYNCVRADLSAAGSQNKSSIGGGFETRDLSLALNRWVERCSPRFEEGVKLGATHVAVRLFTCVCRSRELDPPVGGDQAEGVPAPAAPGLGNA